MRQYSTEKHLNNSLRHSRPWARLRQTALFIMLLTISSGFAGGRLFVGFEYKLNKNWDEISQMTGGHAGLYWGPFSLGGAAYTTISPVEFNLDDQQYTLNRLTYGGLDIRFMPESFSFVNITANCVMGAEFLSFDNDKPFDNDLFLTVEPGVELVLNVSSFIRLGYGISWRASLDSEFQPNEDITGFSSNIIARLGHLNL